ncbi:LysR family transcriptional regulator [Sphingomonas lenta]|uniref:LysR family transcriptional regulator n=1 Tax=Sphingomonas lenta TaxID=1141887 RepID=A0A2A2SKM3_9SPHN|nr:LysR family transcriptional regulator [Sphingomonas lenta]PAX09768.1 LysR family transcriptional regulator [Sphingomonas lenta]
MLDWDDLRHFLAVAETGSTLAAGRRLRVSQTTAARRVAALEEALGLQLFDRRQAGYALTPAGEALLDRARAVAHAAGDFADAAGALARDAGGEVRVTAAAIIATTIMPPILRDLHHAHPAISIELDGSDELRDLAAGAADVAVRTGGPPDGPGLVARRLCDDEWTVYCSRGYAAEHGRPERRRDLPGHEFIGGGEPGVWRIYQSWLQANDLEAAVAMRHSTTTGLLAAVRSGAGLAVLPCLVADQDPDLVRCLRPLPKPERGLWLITHERLRRTPRVRTVLDFLAARLHALARASAG